MSLSNYTLADQYAAVKSEIDKLAETLATLRAQIKDTGRETIEGDFCTLKVSLSERGTLQKDILETMLTPAQIASATKKTTVETIRIKAKVAVAA